MERILNHRHGEMVGVALDRLPPLMRARVESKTDFMLGVDPLFVGLSNGGIAEEYREHAACWYPHHTCEPKLGISTIVVPYPDRPWLYSGRSMIATLLHEMGHVLHGQFGNADVAARTTPYSRKNGSEAWAEQFTIRYAREEHIAKYGLHVVELADGDEAMQELFHQLETRDHHIEFFVPRWSRRRFA
jgi:hypothetical protein